MEERKIKIMTKEQKLALMKDRLNKLEENGKNVKCGGVIRKLRRQVRNAEAAL